MSRRTLGRIRFPAAGGIAASGAAVPPGTSSGQVAARGQAPRNLDPNAWRKPS